MNKMKFEHHKKIVKKTKNLLYNYQRRLSIVSTEINSENETTIIN